MPPTNNLISPAIANKIVPLHSIVNEKMAIRDRIWESVKGWKNQLKYWEAESQHLRKLIRWNRTANKTTNGKILCGKYERITTKDLSILTTKIQRVEKEFISTMMDNYSETKSPLIKFQKLEKELNLFKEELEGIQLQLLENMANTSIVSFF